MAGLSACDSANEPTGPSTDDEFELFDIEFRASPAIPGYPGDGDITVTRESAGGGGGGDNVLVDLIGNAAYTRTGDLAMTLTTNTTLAAPTGEMLCTVQQDGVLTQLVDSNGTVLYSAIGRWVFDGAPDLEGLTAYEKYVVLVGALHVSFDSAEIIDGFPATGNLLAQADHELDYATSTRKLVVTAMVDGVCGGEILEDAGL